MENFMTARDDDQAREEAEERKADERAVITVTLICLGLAVALVAIWSFLAAFDHFDVASP